MRNIKQLTIVVALMTATFGLLAGCGTADDESASPSSLPFEEPTPTTAERPATSTTEAAEEPIGAEPELTAEMFEGMLGTEAGRNLLVGGIATETDLDTAQADCLLDALPLELIVEAATAFLNGDGGPGLFSPDQADTVMPLLELCGIAPDDVLP